MKKITLLILVSFLIISCKTVIIPKKFYFGFDTYQQAYDEFKNKKGNSNWTVLGTHGEWEVVQNISKDTIWVFTPKNHPAHPSVIRKKVRIKNKTSFVNVFSRCGALKPECDILNEDFKKISKGIVLQNNIISEKKCSEVIPMLAFSPQNINDEKYLGHYFIFNFDIGYDGEPLNLELVESNSTESMKEKATKAFGMWRVRPKELRGDNLVRKNCSYKYTENELVRLRQE